MTEDVRRSKLTREQMFALDRFRYAATVVEDWIALFGKDRASKMIGDAIRGEGRYTPQTVDGFRTAFGG